MNRHARINRRKDKHDEKEERQADRSRRRAGRTRPGLAMLIAESEDGQYEPIGVVANIGEARECAQADLRSRMHRLERGDDDPGLCPYSYKIWARGIDGDYRIAIELLADEIPTDERPADAMIARRRGR